MSRVRAVAAPLSMSRDKVVGGRAVDKSKNRDIELAAWVQLQSNIVRVYNSMANPFHPLSPEFVMKILLKRGGSSNKYNMIKLEIYVETQS